MKPIRLAITKCDGHAYWYAPLLARCDAIRLRERFNACHYFLSDLYFPSRITARRVAGFELARVWDRDLEVARRFAEMFDPPPRVCRTVEEATEGVDAAFHAECDADGSDHLERAEPSLRRGLPTFVDKPLALTTKDARTMVRLARRHKAPLFCSSILGYVPEVDMMRAGLRALSAAPTYGTGGTRFDEADLGRVRFGVVKGCWGWTSPSGQEGVIHGLTLAQAVFGTGIEWVQSMGSVPNEYMVLHYSDQLEVVVLNHPFKNNSSFSCEAFTARRYPYRNSVRVDGMADPSFVEGAQRILRAFQRMVRTGKAPVPHESMIELIAAAEAGRISQKRGKRVLLSDVS